MNAVSKNRTLEDIRSDFRSIARAYSEHYRKPAHVGFDFTERSDGESYFSIYVSVDGKIVEMDSVKPLNLLTAKVAKYRRFAEKLSEKSDRERKQLAIILGVPA